jgi:hypothetical protein
MHDKFFMWPRSRRGANTHWYAAHDAVRSRLTKAGLPLTNAGSQNVNAEGHTIGEPYLFEKLNEWKAYIEGKRRNGRALFLAEKWLERHFVEPYEDILNAFRRWFSFR